MDAQGLDIGTRYHFHGDEMTVQRTQDCDPIAEWAKRQQAEGVHGSSDMKLAARIPNVMIEKYCNDKNLTYSEVMGNPHHMRAIVNDPALSAFRIWPGRV